MKKTFITSLLSLLVIISCEKKKDNMQLSDLDYEVDSSAILYDEIDSSSYSKISEIPQTNYSVPIKYSFVVMYTKNQYTGNNSVFTTAVFETSEFITEDERYKIMDEAQSNPRLSMENISKRELKSFDSYAEASKAREQLMK